jgi:anti-sigma regulatory factor (Ser/Thr protein kinase)
MKTNNRENENSRKSITEIEVSLPSDPKCIGEVRDIVLGVCKKTMLSEECSEDFCLAVIEAVTNVMRHSGCEKFVLALKTNEYDLTAIVVDDGNGFLFNEESCKFPAIDSPGGRGLPIICSLVDHLSVNSKLGVGTTLTISKIIKYCENSA